MMDTFGKFSDDDNDSDFDENEDPDEIEVPGGGKDLASLASRFEAKSTNNKPLDIGGCNTTKLNVGILKDSGNISASIPASIKQTITTSAIKGLASSNLLSNKAMPNKFVVINTKTQGTTPVPKIGCLNNNLKISCPKLTSSDIIGKTDINAVKGLVSSNSLSNSAMQKKFVVINTKNQSTTQVPKIGCPNNNPNISSPTLTSSDITGKTDIKTITIPGGIGQQKKTIFLKNIGPVQCSAINIQSITSSEKITSPAVIGPQKKMICLKNVRPVQCSPINIQSVTSAEKITTPGVTGPQKKMVVLKNLGTVQCSPMNIQSLGSLLKALPTTAIQGNHHMEEEVDNEELGVAETYADYMPSKLKIGKKHPDPVVETASLSSVAPVDVWYKLSIPESTINTGALSALQLESITYVSQAHEHVLPDGTRAGFLIGDGAGVGKGRTIAGIIFENYLKDRKRAIWVSVSNDLKYDCQRDLNDIGADMIQVHALNKFKYEKISSSINGNVKSGVVFSTYASLIGESTSTTVKYKTRLKQLLQWCGENFDGLIIFDECHKAKNLCPAGSTKSTKTGMVVVELQNKLPKARVVYASATGASEPKNMAYMVRLGLWGAGTPFKQFAEFIETVEKSGIRGMEIVAMEMKLRGMYIARQLSFQGVSFKIEEVPLSKEFERMYNASVSLWVEAFHKFTEADNLMNSESNTRKTMWGQFWSAHQRFFKYLCIAVKVPYTVVRAREAIKCGKCVVIGLQSTGESGTMEQLGRDDGELTDFVSTVKGVFQSLVEKYFPVPDENRVKKSPKLTSLASKYTSRASNGEENSNSCKRKQTEQLDSKALKRNKRSTSISEIASESSEESGSEISDDEDNSGQARFTDSDSESDFNPFKSGSDSDTEPWERFRKVKLSKKVKKKKKPLKNEELKSGQDIAIDAFLNVGSSSDDALDKVISMKKELLAKIEKLGKKLPINTLDELIDELGGPENVAEMTGRRGRVVQTDDGDIKYESRCEDDIPLEMLNVTEKQRFMNKEKDVAIISEAASSGISLQSDRRVRNQRRRIHITLELPWSADRAIQQFGRTHRSNQVNAPEYIFIISNLAGERRFASTVAKRLESLGALTHGDRRATESRDLSQFNIDNKYGRSALEAVMKAIIGSEAPLVPPPMEYKGDFFKDVAAALVGVGLIVKNGPLQSNLSLDKDYNNISKFLNRILGMPVELQNRLFSYFTDTLNAVTTKAKRSGNFDLGILDLGSGGHEVVKLVRTMTFLRRHATGRAPTELHTVYVERGMSWPEALERISELYGTHDGFYISRSVWNGKNKVVLAGNVDMAANFNLEKDQMFSLYSPNTGLQVKQKSLKELQKEYKKVEYPEAENIWRDQYDSAVYKCSHSYWNGSCKTTLTGQDCETGLRRRTYNVLAGSVLSIWSQVENALIRKNGIKNNKMQVIRLRTEDNVKIVGTLIPKNCVDAVTELLSSDAEKVDEQKFT